MVPGHYPNAALSRRQLSTVRQVAAHEAGGAVAGECAEIARQVRRIGFIDTAGRVHCTGAEQDVVIAQTRPRRHRSSPGAGAPPAIFSISTSVSGTIAPRMMPAPFSVAMRPPAVRFAILARDGFEPSGSRQERRRFSRLISGRRGFCWTTGALITLGPSTRVWRCDALPPPTKVRCRPGAGARRRVEAGRKTP